MKCWYCGTTTMFSMQSRNKYERQVYELILNSHPAKRLADERFHAASIWFQCRNSQVDKYKQTKKFEAGSPRFNQAPASSYSNGDKVLSTAQKKAKLKRDELKSMALEFRRIQENRFQRSDDDFVTFPIGETIEQVRQDISSERYRTWGELITELSLEINSSTASKLDSELGVCFEHLEVLKKRQACEIVIWKESSSETLDEIKFFQHEILAITNKALEAKQPNEKVQCEENEQGEARDQERVKTKEAEEVGAERTPLVDHDQRANSELMEQPENRISLHDVDSAWAGTSSPFRSTPQSPDRYPTVADLERSLPRFIKPSHPRFKRY